MFCRVTLNNSVKVTSHWTVDHLLNLYNIYLSLKKLYNFDSSFIPAKRQKASRQLLPWCMLQIIQKVFNIRLLSFFTLMKNRQAEQFNHLDYFSKGEQTKGI